MKTGLVFHNDLDGLYSAILLKAKHKYDDFFPIDYGNHFQFSHLCDELHLVDYAENVAPEKTTLWIDHHLREEVPDFALIKESPSCTRLVYDEIGGEMPESYLQAIDIIDSANYSFNREFTREDVIFPEPKNLLSKLLILNQLLMKNRRTNLAAKLLQLDTYDIDVFLYHIETYDVYQYRDYMHFKKRLIEKLIANHDTYIKIIDKVPILSTKKFSMIDWKGYDRNLFYYLVMKHPYNIVSFEMSGKYNFQICRNPFYKKKLDFTLVSLIGDDLEEIRGHEDILNLTFTDHTKALETLDVVIEKISSAI